MPLTTPSLLSRGSPGGNYEDYKQHPELAFEDLRPGVRGHGGGPFANPFLNAAQQFAFSPNPLLLKPHGESGAPDFKDWPAFNAGTREQMHITQIRRSYEGGIRLMVGLATDNLGAEFLVSPLENGNVRLVDEFDSLNAQIRGMVEQARLNSSWMQIAYSPEDARDIILHNKLSVIMGLEVDNLGNYGDRFPTISDELDYFWNLGVRAVTPIHAIDNKLGGSMVFFDIYNWLAENSCLEFQRNREFCSFFAILAPQIGLRRMDCRRNDRCPSARFSRAETSSPTYNQLRSERLAISNRIPYEVDLTSLDVRRNPCGFDRTDLCQH